jgi:hypothetical protein
MYELIYKQTRGERYDTDMNERAHAVLTRHKIAVHEEFGGTGFSDDPYELVAENGYVIDTDEMTARRLAKIIESEVVGRTVAVSEITDDDD